MSNFLQDPNDPPVAEAPAPETDADGNLPWEQAPQEGYDAATSGGEGESAETESGADGDAGDAGDDPETDEEQAEGAEPEPEPEPTLDASAEAADDGEGDPGPPPYYLPCDEIKVDYEVQVQPPPADRSEALVYRHEVDAAGEPLSTHTLVTSGTGQLTVPLSERTIEDSPLFIRFEFEKGGASRPLVAIDRAFSLAEPEVRTIEARREVKAGEAHALKVATWGALAYDRPGQATWFEAPEVDPAKVTPEQKADVRWRVEGRDVAELTGDEVEHTFAEDQAGKKVTVDAHRKEQHAQVELLVGKVAIHGGARARGPRPAPPAVVPLEADIDLRAYLDPEELAPDATFSWESSSDKVTLTPGEGGLVTARGAAESESDGDVTLTAKATVNGVEWSAAHAVSVRKVPQIKALDGTTDPSPWAPQWHYVHLKAVVPEGLRGTFQWEVSDKLRIMGGTARRQEVKVMARRLSDAAADQWVKVTFTPRGGAAFPVVEHKLTAVAVVFSKDANQRYGFDNMDHETGKPPRLSVKKNDYTTVKVNLLGPGFTSEKVTFDSENATIAEAVAPAAGETEFSLRINGKAQNKAEVPLRVRLADGDRLRCATLNVCVYKQFEVTCTVYRVHDSTVPATAVAAFDVPAAQTLMNGWYKAAVVRCTLTDGGLIDCNYDKNSNGKCELRCRADSEEETAVTTAIGAGAGTKAVIVKDVNWRFTLTAAAAIGDTALTLDQGAFMNVGNTYAINDSTGAVKERVTVGALTAGAPATLTVNPALTVAHAAGSYIDWPLAGRSGNPAWVEEGTQVVKTCVLAHELGHQVLRYKDVHQLGLIMNYHAQNNSNLTVRYKKLTHYYDATGSENQWDMITR